MINFHDIWKEKEEKDYKINLNLSQISISEPIQNRKDRQKKNIKQATMASEETLK